MPTPVQVPRAEPAEQSSTDTEDQLQFQFWTLIDSYRRHPPERVYWRDAVKLRLKHALGTAALWVVHKRRVTPRTVHHVALAVYYYANGAGMVQISQATMAEDCEIDTASFSRAITVLKRLGLLRAFRTSRRAAETLAMNIGGLTWTAARKQARERHRLARTSTPRFDFDGPSTGYEPPLHGPSTGYEPTYVGVRTGTTTTTTTTRERDEPTDRQLGFAEDLGIDPTGMDVVELGDAIEQARTKRRELRTAAASRSRGDSESPPDPTEAQLGFAEDLGIDPTGMDVVELGDAIEQARTKRRELRTAAASQNGSRSRTRSRQPTPTERRRTAEAEAYRRRQNAAVHQLPAADPAAAAAHERRQALETAAALGFQEDPNDAAFLIHHDGRRVPNRIGRNEPPANATDSPAQR